MTSVEFCEVEFNKKAIDFINMSEILSDNWKINEKDEKFYLSKKQTILLKSQQKAVVLSDDDDPAAAPQDTRNLISMEYHVLFHPSYQVPALYFNAHSEGSLIPLNELPNIFVDDYEFKTCKNQLQNIITQAEHPILFKPFFHVHPCKVNQVLSHFNESKNFILTFLTIFGPSIHLKMSTEYEKFV